jgi:3'-5' exoribonuclease
MSRDFVSKLRTEQAVDQIFLASSKQLRSNRQGSLYLQFQLSDRSGSIDARMWNASEDKAERFADGDYVRVRGTTQVFQGALQLIANRVEKVSATDVDDADFRLLPEGEIQHLRDRLTERLTAIGEVNLRALAEVYLQDESFMEKFCRAPAGVKNHHAYHGGLLQHVVQLCDLIDRIADLYPGLDHDLILMGAFLHDSGKVDELGYERDLYYTDGGQLLGHIIIAISMLDAKFSELSQAFPEELALRLKHLIVSHHGSLDCGSPTVPMTLEAIALHQLDNFDAKVNQFEQLIRDDNNLESHWTQYHPNLGRKFYKGAGGTDGDG